MSAHAEVLAGVLATVALVALAAVLLGPGGAPQPPPGVHIDARVYYDGVDTMVVVWHPAECTVTRVEVNNVTVYPGGIAEKGETRDTYIAPGVGPGAWAARIKVDAVCGETRVTVQMVKRVVET